MAIQRINGAEYEKHEHAGKTKWPGWETVRLIGQGSYGAVYEIQRKLVDGTVAKAALKVISIPPAGGRYC